MAVIFTGAFLVACIKEMRGEKLYHFFVQGVGVARR
jgi:hypothetical protein